MNGDADEAPVQPEFGESGLLPAVVQDVRDGRVRMLAHMNREALARTRATGRVTFWSRSREELWEKGESSGNWLEARSVELDCDGDALLVRAVPHGPTCHTGRESCFDARTMWTADGTSSFGAGRPASAGAREASSDAVARDRPSATGADPLAEILLELRDLVERRDLERPGGSYTVELLDGGPEFAGRKVAEEALELALAAASEPERADEESADLLYHLLVLWRCLDLDSDDVARVLRRRRPGRGE